LYLFSDKFVERARFLGEMVPCSKNKVKQDELANALVATSISWLNENGSIDLELGKRSKMLGLRKTDTMIVRKRRRPEASSSSLENMIWSMAEDGENIHEITCKLIGRESNVPFALVINHVKDYLVEEGYYSKKRRMLMTRHEPNCEKIKEVEGETARVSDFINKIREQKDVYNLISKEINDAIKSMTESDVD
jgi:hypothetical protein